MLSWLSCPCGEDDEEDSSSEEQPTSSSSEVCHRMGLCVTVTSVHDINTSNETAAVGFDTTYFLAADSPEEAFELIRYMAGETWVVGGIDTSDIDEGAEFTEQDELKSGCHAIEFHRCPYLRNLLPPCQYLKYPISFLWYV